MANSLSVIENNSKRFVNFTIRLQHVVSPFQSQSKLALPSLLPKSPGSGRREQGTCHIHGEDEWLASHCCHKVNLKEDENWKHCGDKIKMSNSK